jgi:DNA polymerase III gamma/tau subunit
MRFSDIVGQQYAKSILLKAANTGRLPHALIFLDQLEPEKRPWQGL